jgi:micrococcal nuclease
VTPQPSGSQQAAPVASPVMAPAVRQPGAPSVDGSNGGARTPTLSAPLATNIGNAPAKVTASTSFAVDAQGNTTPVEPVKISKSDLGKPEPVVQAAPGAVPKQGAGRVVSTFVTNARGKQVKDGDSFTYVTNSGKPLPNAGNSYECRLEEIDAPETSKGPDRPGQPYAEEAAATLRRMVENREINITVSRVDRYGRDICQVEVQGRNVSLELLELGQAWLYKTFVATSPRAPEFIKARDKAKQEKVGIHSQPDSKEPDIWRRTMWPRNR